MANRWNIVVLCALFAAIALLLSRDQTVSPEVEASPSGVAAARSGSVEAVPVPGHVGSAELPNLVITDIYYEQPYFKVKYKNIGEARVSADFNISWSSPAKTFKGNRYYRAQVPSPEDERMTGGLTVGLVGAKEGQPIQLTVEIDSENRVAESDESDNAKTVTLTVGEPGSNKSRLELAEPSYIYELKAEQPPDLIVVDARLENGEILVTYANQGFETSQSTFDAEAGRRQGGKERVSGLQVPDPGSTASFKVEALGWEPSEIVEITLDVENQVAEGRENNNTFYRQLDGAHNLNGRPAP